MEPYQVTTGPSGPVEARKPKSRIVSFRVDEDDFARLDALARQTSYSRGEVLRRCLWGARLASTVDAQRLGGLLKLAIREGVSDPSSYHRHSRVFRGPEGARPNTASVDDARPVQRRKGVVGFSEGVEIQFGDPNARRGAPQVDITS